MGNSDNDIHVIEGCNPADLDLSLLDKDRPLVFKGLVSQWPVVAAANQSARACADYLQEFATEDPVVAYIGAPEIDGRFFYNDDFTQFNFTTARASLAQVMQRLLNPQGEMPTIYVGSTMVDRWLPGFRGENDLQLPFNDTLASVWVGNQVQVSAHFDFPDNMACVLAGKRRFTLFPPDQIDNLYVGPLDRTPSGQSISTVDLKSPDLARYPRFAEAMASAKTAELDAGDAIFIPSMWWHNVQSLSDFNVLLNYWWCSSPAFMGPPTAALKLAILALRDLPERQRSHWKKIFSHYVFDANPENFSHIPAQGRGLLNPLDDETSRKLRAELLNILNQ